MQTDRSGERTAHVRDNNCLPSESARGMHFYLINSFVSTNDEECASLWEGILENQGSRKILLTIWAMFFIVLIISFSRKMTERTGPLLEFW